jgi:hypothetical protein
MFCSLPALSPRLQEIRWLLLSRKMSSAFAESIVPIRNNAQTGKAHNKAILDRLTISHPLFTVRAANLSRNNQHRIQSLA